MGLLIKIIRWEKVMVEMTVVVQIVFALATLFTFYKGYRYLSEIDD